LSHVYVNNKYFLIAFVLLHPQRLNGFNNQHIPYLILRLVGLIDHHRTFRQVCELHRSLQLHTRSH